MTAEFFILLYVLLGSVYWTHVADDIVDKDGDEIARVVILCLLVIAIWPMVFVGRWIRHS